MQTEKTQKAISLLQEKARELDRLPKKSDFPPESIVFIKQMLGPWTRALEKAELKPVSQSYLEKKARCKAKRREKRNSRQEKQEKK